jgi:hypothetical protein
MFNKRIKVAFGALVLLAGFHAVGAGLAESTTHPLRDIDGVLQGSLENPSGWTWTLLFFLMSDCPIGNQYAKEIQRICSSYGPKGVRCFLVYVDPTMSAGDIRKHMKEFNYTCCSAIQDTHRDLVDKAGAMVVSEVAVFSSKAELKYRGRIDDLYAGLGKPRQVVTHHDLRDALDALIAGRNVPNPVTQAFGCFIPPKLEN